jgi:hypothetical protein
MSGNPQKISQRQIVVKTWARIMDFDFSFSRLSVFPSEEVAEPKLALRTEIVPRAGSTGLYWGYRKWKEQDDRGSKNKSSKRAGKGGDTIRAACFQWVAG